jgi:hypothetical protein
MASSISRRCVRMILPRFGDPQINLQRIGLPLGFGFESLQPVTPADEVDDGDLDAALCERHHEASCAPPPAIGAHRRAPDNPSATTGDASASSAAPVKMTDLSLSMFCPHHP